MRDRETENLANRANIRVTDRRPPHYRPYSAVRGGIRRATEADLRRGAFDRWLQAARRAADVEYVSTSGAEQ